MGATGNLRFNPHQVIEFNSSTCNYLLECNEDKSQSGRTSSRNISATAVRRNPEISMNSTCLERGARIFGKLVSKHQDASKIFGAHHGQKPVEMQLDEAGAICWHRVLQPYLFGAGCLMVMCSLALLLSACTSRPATPHDRWWETQKYDLVDGDGVCAVCLTEPCGDVHFNGCGHSVVCLTC